MRTEDLARAETRTLSIAAAPARVVGYLDDPRNLPEWAPAFATEVRVAGEEIVVNPGPAEMRMKLMTAAQAGTVDLVAAAAPRLGVFMRVLPNGEGSEVLFTLFFPDGTPEDAVEQQMAEVEAELERVRAACTT